MKNGEYGVAAVIAELKKHSSQANVDGMKRFGVEASKNLGVSMPPLRKLAKTIGINQNLALELYKAGYHETKILAALIADKKMFTRKLCEEWVKGFDSWDVCDQVVLAVFAELDFSAELAFEWSEREEEYVKRAGFVVMAVMAVHAKSLPDDFFREFFPVIMRESVDSRNFVKKSVNWALRQIGKRNAPLFAEATAVAVKLSDSPVASARWIGNNALREFEKPANKVKERVEKY